MNTPTPRTEIYVLNPPPESVPASFARELERENLNLREALQKFYDVNTRYGIGGLGMDEYIDANKSARDALNSQHND